MVCGGIYGGNLSRSTCQFLGLRFLFSIHTYWIGCCFWFPLAGHRYLLGRRQLTSFKEESCLSTECCFTQVSGISSKFIMLYFGLVVCSSMQVINRFFCCWLCLVLFGCFGPMLVAFGHRLNDLIIIVLIEFFGPMFVVGGHRLVTFRFFLVLWGFFPRWMMYEFLARFFGF